MISIKLCAVTCVVFGLVVLIARTTEVAARLSPGKSGLDIVLLVDTSSSIGRKSLESAKKFMKLLVDVFGVSDDPLGGKDGTRFALVTFSGRPKIEFNLDDANARSKYAVKAAIDRIQNTGGGTDVRRALVNVFSSIYFAKMRYSRNKARLHGATRAIFIITDAEVTSTLETNRIQLIKSVAEALKKGANFEIFSIGIGINIDKFVLAELASPPYTEHVFLLPQFKDLDKVVDIITGRNIDYGQCGISGKTNIPHGAQKAAKGAWPWLGWLSVVGDDMLPQTCGGALLCDRWFLTAASCVSKLDNNTVVPFNTLQINLHLSDHHLYKQDVNEVWSPIRGVLIHPDYTGEQVGELGIREYDVALLDLGEHESMRPVLNKYLRPLCFAADNASLASAGAQFNAMLSFPQLFEAYTAGWGHAPDNARYMETLSGELKQNQRPVQKRKACKGRYPGIDLDMFFCVGDEFVESDSCSGDIGGPYMVRLANKRYYSFGLALNTRGCNIRYRFSIFLNLLHTSVSGWMGPILDGCNRVEEIDD